MNYKCSYNNSTFPYNKSHKKSTQEPEKSRSCVDNTVDNVQKNPPVSNVFSSILQSILSPIENAIGRKISFDDLILVALIYLLYTEKDNDNNILLLCLLFLLF
ncbi:MAG: hypothetical protein E7314_02705 [Clostridiales bacterium]|nr:hypothetical protein [Clostridiales bacterium]